MAASRERGRKVPLLGKGGVAAVSADGVVRLFSSNPQSAIPNPKSNGGWQPLRLTGWFIPVRTGSGSDWVSSQSKI